MALSIFSKQLGKHSIIWSIKEREIQTSNLSKTCVAKELGHSAHLISQNTILVFEAKCFLFLLFLV